MIDYDEDFAALAAQLRDAQAEIARLQKATVGRCASCGRDNRVVYHDREALVCADYDDCWAFIWPNGLPAPRAPKEARADKEEQG